MSPSLDQLVKQGEGAQDAVDLGDGVFMSRNIANSYLVTTPDGDLIINTGTDFEAPEIKARFSRVSQGPLRMLTFTQGHPDHVSGWSQFNQPGVETIAQANHPDVREYWRHLHPFYVRRIMRLWGAFMDVETAAATLPLEPVLTTSFIDTHAFDQKFLEESTALGHPLRGAEVLPLLGGEVRPRMVEALLICKQHFKVGCITNNVIHGHGPGMATSPERASRATDIMRHFHAIVESSKAGIRKPDPRIYMMMCELLGVAPKACVYLDDLGINCKPAAQLGMTAIKVVSEAQALVDLEGITGLKFPPPASSSQLAQDPSE